MTSTDATGSGRRSSGGIRLGIMCNGTAFPAWQAEAIRGLLAIDEVNLVALIVNGRRSSGSRLSRIRDRKHLLWLLFNKGHAERASRASRATDLSDELGEVPRLRCTTVPSGRFGEAFVGADLDAIREFELDVVLRFGFGILKGDILSLPKYGIWSFHHGDERAFRGRPPFFWEMLAGEQVVGAILQRLTDRLDGGVVLHRGFFKVTPQSYLRTRDEAFLGSAEWPSIVVRQILNGESNPVDADPSPTNASVRRDPGNGTTLLFLWRQALAFLGAQWRGMTRAAQWSVGVAPAPIEAFLGDRPPDLTWYPSAPRGRYLADPFAVRHNGDLVVLVEEFDYVRNRGVISALSLGVDDPPPRVVIDPGVHASYPYLFEAEGEIWCIPETYQAREVRLYRALQFPDKWEHVATPIKGLAALDSTVILHQGRWWMFLTDQDAGPNTKLRIWHASHLTGEWKPHLLNPVKTDVRSSRPAGTPFVVDGVLYRPAQDCSHSYGGGIVINRVDDLTATTYTEVAVSRIEPQEYSPFPDGIHTVCAVGDTTVVDGRRDVFIAAAFRRELRSRLARLVRS